GRHRRSGGGGLRPRVVPARVACLDVELHQDMGPAIARGVRHGCARDEEVERRLSPDARLRLLSTGAPGRCRPHHRLDGRQSHHRPLLGAARGTVPRRILALETVTTPRDRPCTTNTYGPPGPSNSESSSRARSAHAPSDPSSATWTASSSIERASSRRPPATRT